MGCVKSHQAQVDDYKLTLLEKKRLEQVASTTNIRSVYEFQSVIGKGAFGTVKLACLKNSINDKKIAIKIIDKSQLKQKQYLLLRELDMMKNLDHPNIIKFYEVYQDEMFFYICMEYCAGGELLERITKKKVFSEKEASIIIEKIFSAINHMHSRGVVHRDIKPENVLFSTKYPDSEIKLIDFGLSTKFENNSNLSTMVGTPIYVSPNVLEGNYDKTCDNWSAGVILYILLVGYPPFFGNNKNEIFKKIRSGDYTMDGFEWANVSQLAKDLVSKLLVVKSKKRYTAAEVLQHPWIKKYQKNNSIIKSNNSIFSPGIVTGQQNTNGNNSTGVNNSQDKVDPKIVNLLKNFSYTSKFKKEVIRVIVNQLNEKEIESLKAQFKKIDKDQTGLIRVDELKEVMNNAGYTSSKEEIEQIIRKISSQDNKDLTIKYSEFLAATLDVVSYLKQEKIWSIFKYFDPSNTNYISIADLREILLRNGRDIPELEIKQMVKEVNPENDGNISLAEFSRIMMGEQVDFKS
ncbi:hypothetical protein ABPG72_002764 [Tetrahymena utriculariae]